MQSRQALSPDAGARTFPQITCIFLAWGAFVGRRTKMLSKCVMSPALCREPPHYTDPTWS